MTTPLLFLYLQANVGAPAPQVIPGFKTGVSEVVTYLDESPRPAVGLLINPEIPLVTARRADAMSMVPKRPAYEESEGVHTQPYVAAGEYEAAAAANGNFEQPVQNYGGSYYPPRDDGGQYLMHAGSRSEAKSVARSSIGGEYDNPFSPEQQRQFPYATAHATKSYRPASAGRAQTAARSGYQQPAAPSSVRVPARPSTAGFSRKAGPPASILGGSAYATSSPRGIAAPAGHPFAFEAPPSYADTGFVWEPEQQQQQRVGSGNPFARPATPPNPFADPEPLRPATGAWKKASQGLNGLAVPPPAGSDWKQAFTARHGSVAPSAAAPGALLGHQYDTSRTLSNADLQATRENSLAQHVVPGERLSYSAACSFYNVFPSLFDQQNAAAGSANARLVGGHWVFVEDRFRGPGAPPAPSRTLTKDDLDRTSRGGIKDITLGQHVVPSAANAR